MKIQQSQFERKCGLEKDRPYVPMRGSVETKATKKESVGMAWQDIKTAPKDGTEVLLLVKIRAGIPRRQLVGHYIPGGHCIEDHPPIDSGWYFWNGAMFDKASDPTHWMPLPDLPN